MKAQKNPMLPVEKRAATSIATLFSTRMLGMFMILPVLGLYAFEAFENVTAFQVGLAIGIYGLGQALFQIPFGIASDRFGRKPVIAFGLLLFAIGSAVAATAQDIETIIIGRALQGVGAVASVLMALLADLTREERRLSAMSIVGITIGGSFTLSLMAGPLLYEWISVPGIFAVTGGLAVLGIVLLYTWVPDAEKISFHRDAQVETTQLMKVLKAPELLRLDYGIFTLHMVLTSVFVALPFAMERFAGLSVAQHWQLYLPVMILSFILMIPFIIMAEAKYKMKEVFVACVAIIMATTLGLAFLHHSYIQIFILLMIFFTAFNVLEATLPSLISKTAPADKKGTAMGIYSSSQFMGAFLGGVMGGLLYDAFDEQGTLLFASVATLIWLLVSLNMKKPKQIGTFMLNLGEIKVDEIKEIEARFMSFDGVVEAKAVKADGIVYLKLDNSRVDKSALERFSSNQLGSDTNG